MDLFECGAVLFESDEDGETLRIECAVTGEGGLDFLQESEGPLTEWSFEETPHRIEVSVPPIGAMNLATYFHLDMVTQLPAVLRLEYVGYDCLIRIRALMRRLEIPYCVVEAPIVR